MFHQDMERRVIYGQKHERAAIKFVYIVSEYLSTGHDLELFTCTLLRKGFSGWLSQAGQVNSRQRAKGGYQLESKCCRHEEDH